MIYLEPTTKADRDFRAWMADHYSAPRGFVGRQLLYKIWCAGECWGGIAGGSATLHLPGRKDFFGEVHLNRIVNNTFYHLAPGERKYPRRNFSTAVVKAWRAVVSFDWMDRYGDDVLGFETLVEPPRSGELYLRDGWTEGGLTQGFTCKRVSGKSSDGWSGLRVWDYDSPLRPKRVFYYSRV